jgi:hypothetical protein
MTDEWTIKLTRDEGVVLADYLTRWQETNNAAFQDEAERVARDNLVCLLERADDGTAFASDYAEQVAAARKRLRPES